MVISLHRNFVSFVKLCRSPSTLPSRRTNASVNNRKRIQSKRNTKSSSSNLKQTFSSTNSGSQSGIFFSPVSILKSYVLQRFVNCAVIKGSNFLGLAGPLDLPSSLSPTCQISSWPAPGFGARCRTGIMRRLTWRRLPPTSLVLTLTQRPDTGERARGTVTHSLHRNNFRLWLQVYPGGRQGLGIAAWHNGHGSGLFPQVLYRKGL